MDAINGHGTEDFETVLLLHLPIGFLAMDLDEPVAVPERQPGALLQRLGDEGFGRLETILRGGFGGAAGSMKSLDPARLAKTLRRSSPQSIIIA